MKHILYLALIFWSSITFGEQLTKTELINPNTNGKVWVYLPENSNQQTLPVILIPPAGSRLFHGMTLSEGDSPEHKPYVNAGFAVISFDLSGPWPAIETDQAIFSAITGFVSRRAGVDDAKEALDLAKKKFRILNLDEVYVAGHSSAGTVSLMIAQQLPNIKAAIAYAPIIDTQHYLAEISNMVRNEIPAFKTVLIDTSPHNNIAKYTMPIFLFVAKDDTHMSDQMESYTLFKTSLHKAGTKITFNQVESGGHYQSMINEGIPSAIQWLKSLRSNQVTKEPLM